MSDTGLRNAGVLWAEWHAPKIHVSKPLSLAPEDEAAFSERVFKEVMKLKRACERRP